MHRKAPSRRFKPRFDAAGLIPAIAQDAEDSRILMVAFMNREALQRTLDTGVAHYFSRSKNRIWKKGERSGHVQTVLDILTDCDQDALILKVRQAGPGACHLGYRSCFFRAVRPAGALELIDERQFDPDSVY
ncbi:MAG: phosphoribosyl-AMP cyclohydrolase [Rhodothalassiaceae bacterium]